MTNVSYFIFRVKLLFPSRMQRRQKNPEQLVLLLQRRKKLRLVYLIIKVVCLKAYLGLKATPMEAGRSMLFCLLKQGSTWFWYNSALAASGLAGKINPKIDGVALVTRQYFFLKGNNCYVLVTDLQSPPTPHGWFLCTYIFFRPKMIQNI